MNAKIAFVNDGTKKWVTQIECVSVDWEKQKNNKKIYWKIQHQKCADHRWWMWVCGAGATYSSSVQNCRCVCAVWVLCVRAWDFLRDATNYYWRQPINYDNNLGVHGSTRIAIHNLISSAIVLCMHTLWWIDRVVRWNSAQSEHHWNGSPFARAFGINWMNKEAHRRWKTQKKKQKKKNQNRRIAANDEWYIICRIPNFIRPSNDTMHRNDRDETNGNSKRRTHTQNDEEHEQCARMK